MIKGNMKVGIVVAICVWWTTVVGAPLAREPVIDLVAFTTEHATVDSYRQFLHALRNVLNGTVNKAIDKPILRDPSTVPDSIRFVLVELSNEIELSITLAVDVKDMYVVGYRAGRLSRFFSDAPTIAYELFRDTPSEGRRLPFEGGYPDLKRYAGTGREVFLGFSELSNAITSIYLKSNPIDPSIIARSLIVCIQMVSEAARFRYLEGKIIVYKRYKPESDVLSLENNWNALSKAIQSCDENKVFTTGAVVLKKPNGDPFRVDRVTPHLKNAIGIMKFFCRGRSEGQTSQSLVADFDGICIYSEPTVRINGQNGLCIDVQGGLYNDGDPIILGMCTEQLSMSQLWTLKADSTIQSNGKCLATSGFIEGSNVVIFNCATGVTDATHWKIFDNGNIINLQSGLVLSSEVDQSVSINKITVRTNHNDTSQGWLASNNSDPLVTSIVGFTNLCMEAKRETVRLAECASSKAEQKWVIYADGSIRLQQNPTFCLQSAFQGESVGFFFCTGMAPERWTFRDDGTILNMFNNMVIEADTGGQIIMWPFTENSNQKWLLLL